MVKCVNCKHFEMTEFVDTKERPYGWCHLNPPQNIADIENPGRYYTSFPMVGLDQWCSKYIYNKGPTKMRKSK